MSEVLVQIEVPPTHQSTEFLTACPVFYWETTKKKRRKPSGPESARGTQVHKTMGLYATHCAKKRVKMDLEAFDRFSAGAGPVAAKILLGIRDSYEVDYEHLLQTELPMSLDADMNPTQVHESLKGIVRDSGKPPAYQGTLDAPYLFEDEKAGQIDDFKTHARPYDPADEDKSLQGKMYSLFIFLHFPWVQIVRFRLVFVRYRSLVRVVEYTREDVPRLMEAVMAQRNLQISIHEDVAAGKTLEAYSGSQCQYCPLLSNRECPLADMNEHSQMSYEERVRWDLFYSAFSRVNRKVLRERVEGTGRAVVVRDYNGKAYSFGPESKESRTLPLFKKTAEGIAFRCTGCGAESPRPVQDGRCPKCGAGMTPVMPIVSLFEDYANGNPDDVKWLGNALISSSSVAQPLSTKKRAFLDQSVEDTAVMVPKVTMKTSRPLDTIPDEEPESEWGEDEDF